MIASVYDRYTYMCEYVSASSRILINKNSQCVGKERTSWFTETAQRHDSEQKIVKVRKNDFCPPFHLGIWKLSILDSSHVGSWIKSALIHSYGQEIQSDGLPTLCVHWEQKYHPNSHFPPTPFKRLSPILLSTHRFQLHDDREFDRRDVDQYLK